MINKYPYTDFNEYNMDWIIKTVKDLTVQWAETHQEWKDVQTEWKNYKNYIDTYFANLDLTQEVSTILYQMADDGTIYNIFHDTAASVAADVTSDWIADNLLQETGYVIDTSLTVANAAADAKATGDRINVVESTIYDYSGLVEFRAWETGRIATNTATIDPTVVDPNVSWKHMVIDCSGLTYVCINARGANSTYRPFAFIDGSNNKIVAANTNALYDLLYPVPASATKLILNCAAAYVSDCYVYSGKWNMAKTDLAVIKNNFNTRALNACYGVGLWDIISNELNAEQYMSRMYQGKSTPVTYDHDIMLGVKDGYKMKVYADINGTWTKLYNDAWIADQRRIPANTEFIVEVTEFPVDSSHIITIDEMTNAVYVKDPESRISFDNDYMSVQKAKIIAHRGYMGDPTNIPPNSISAVQKAIDLGAWCIETDIRETSDHYFVIMHDATVDATTDGSGTVANMTLAQIEALHLNGGSGTEKVPTLEEVLQEIKPYGVVLLCDLKGYDNLTTSVPAIIDLIRHYGLEKNVIFSCYNESEISFLEVHYPDILKFYTCPDNNDFQDCVDIMLNYTNAGIVFPSTDLMTYIDQIVPACRPYDIMIVMYSSSSWAAQCSYFHKGVDIVTSNSNLTAQ